MMRHVRWIALLVVVLIGAQIVVRGAGGRIVRPVNDFTDFSQITLPSGARQACWHAICPGQLSMKQAAVVMNGIASLEVVDGYDPESDRQCWEDHSQTTEFCLEGTDSVSAVSIQLKNHSLSMGIGPVTRDSPVKFGDLVLGWGTPTSVGFPFCWSSSVFFDNGAQTNIEWVPYTQTNDYSDTRWELSPSNNVLNTITIVERVYMDNGGNLWTGFVARQTEMACGE